MRNLRFQKGDIVHKGDVSNPGVFYGVLIKEIYDVKPLSTNRSYNVDFAPGLR